MFIHMVKRMERGGQGGAEGGSEWGERGRAENVSGESELGGGSEAMKRGGDTGVKEGAGNAIVTNR